MRSLLVALSAVLAPIQCGSPPRERPEFEDSPPEALWDLSVHFEDAGDRPARDRTLRFLLDRYPSSRFAEHARDILDRVPAAP